jgi:NADP-dependent 3-hydroxy acid dehydrogenase YdfG
MTQTVVITGASAGIARAAARLYGARGASVGLIARGQAGLDGTAKDVIDAGGQAGRWAGGRGPRSARDLWLCPALPRHSSG